MSLPGLRTAAQAQRPGELFQFLRDGVPRTRAELAAVSGLSRSTVAARVDSLVASGLVSPVGEAASSGGRPPSRFAFDPAARVVLAVEIGATHAVVALRDLAAAGLAENRSELEVGAGPEAVLDAVTRSARTLLRAARRTRDEVAGIGIGLPGPVEHNTGRPRNPPIMPGWDGFDVPGYLRRTFNVPVLVDNDVNIMALGEQSLHWPDDDDLLFVKAATGIGAGIVSGGILQRGAVGTAGDLGHVRVPGAEDVLCRCGNTGCLEAVAGGPAIAARLVAAGHSARGSRDVVALVRAGNNDAVAAVRQAGRDIGEVLAMAVNLLNPSTIVVGGSLAAAGEHLLAGIREVVYQRSLPLATAQLRIVTSRGAENAGPAGAAMLVIRHVLAPEAIDSRLSAIA